MEWQMSGGDAAEPPSAAPVSEPRGPPTEAEEFQALSEGEVGEEDTEEEGLKVRRGNESKSEAVLEKAGKQDQ